MNNGEIVFGKYRIVKLIGQGGMGTVYLATDTKLQSQWAIKQVSKHSNINFLAEPNMLKKLRHPNLPIIVDVFEDNDYIYIIEDYIEGEPLDNQLKKVGKFSEEYVVEWAKQLVDILDYLHNQKPNPIIFRDLKPSNIITAGKNRLKVIDFGIAREYKEEKSMDTVFTGTKGYAAPEQYGLHQTDERTDVFNLGATLYHLITGKGPDVVIYEAVNIRDINKDISEALAKVISKCVKSNPDERYQSAQELILALQNIGEYNRYVSQKQSRKKIYVGLSIWIVISIISIISGFSIINGEKIVAVEINQDGNIATSDKPILMSPGEEKLLTLLAKKTNNKFEKVDKQIGWSSKNSEIAEISQGKLIANKPGETSISAEIDGEIAVCKIIVEATELIKYGDYFVECIAGTDTNNDIYEGNIKDCFIPNPSNIAADSLGNLYIAGSILQKMQDGDIEVMETINGARIAGVDKNNNLYYITNPYIGDEDKHFVDVYKKGSNGIEELIYTTNNAFDNLMNMAFDQEGNIYVTIVQGELSLSPPDIVDSYIIKIDAASKKWSKFNKSNIGFANGIAIDRNNKIYVSDTLKSVIYILNQDGSVESLIGMENSEVRRDGDIKYAQFQVPSTLAVDAENNIYVVDGELVRLIKSTGEVITIAGQLGISGIVKSDKGENSLFSAAIDKGLCIGNNNELYLSDVMYNVIYKIKSDL